MSALERYEQARILKQQAEAQIKEAEADAIMEMLDYYSLTESKTQELKSGVKVSLRYLTRTQGTPEIETLRELIEIEREKHYNRFRVSIEGMKEKIERMQAKLEALSTNPLIEELEGELKRLEAEAKYQEPTLSIKF